MASNNIPPSAKQRSQLAGKMVRGIHQKGASIPITIVTEAQVQADLSAFNAAENVFGNARKTLKEAYDVFAPTDEDLTGFLNAARPALIGHFGYSWTADWAAAGFVNGSTAIPDRIEDRLGLARSLVVFFTANPTFEVASTGATAANGDAKRLAAENAQGAVSDADQALKQADIARTPATAALLADMRGLIKNLSGKLAKDDPRWLAFGLQMPATDITPAKPTGLMAQMDEMSGGLVLTCDAQPYAERFRWRGREAGSSLPFELIARSTQPTARTQPYNPGTSLELMVQAVNGSAQSVPSDSIFFTVPAAVTLVTTAARPASAETEVSLPNGNGNGSAKGNGSRSLTRVS
jgi:hypothetical protein